MGGIIKIWDYETFRIKGIFGNGGLEINSLAFIEPFPLVATVDNLN